MSTHTQQFLEEICRRHERPCTGYAIARIMRDRYGWSEQTAYNYRKGSTAPDDRKALDIAAELELDPMYVIACIQADRAADAELRSMWEGMAERARRTAAAVILAGALVATFAGGMLAPSAAYARQAISFSTDPIYIMRITGWCADDRSGCSGRRVSSVPVATSSPPNTGKFRPLRLAGAEHRLSDQPSP